MEKLSERFMFYSGLLAAYKINHPNVDIDIKADDLKYIQDLIDAEEQGLFLRLPCKVGDILWHFEGRMREPMPCTVKEFIVRKYRFDRVEIYFEDCEGFSVCDFNGNLDEGWYLTFEEAEQALAEMKNIEEAKNKLAEEVESIGYLSKEEAKRMIEQALAGKKEV